MESRNFSLPQERSVARSTARINIWEGAIRSGKTIASLLRWLTFIGDAPAGELVMVGKTAYTVGRNALLQLQDPSLFGIMASSVVYTLGAPVATIFGRRVHVIGANDAKAETKIRGLTVSGAYVDEATILPQQFFQQLLGRMSVPGAKLFATTNADSSAHWIRKGFLLRADEPDMDLRAFHFTLDDNPSLTDAYKASIKSEFTGLWYKRFVEGQWCAAEGAVYDMFDVDRHVADILPVIKRWLCCSIDYGTTNPLAALVIGIGVDGRLYVVAEWWWDSRARHRQLTDAEYSVKIREFLASIQFPGSQLFGVSPEYIVVDPSAASFRQQLHQDRFTVHSGNNDVLDGIRTVSTLLGQGRLLIHSSCRNLIDEMQSYSWDESAALKGDDKPVKADDHAVDALRYGIMTTRSLWLQAIRPAGIVRNREEYFSIAGVSSR